MTTVEISGRHGEPSSRKSVWLLQNKMSGALSACVVEKYFKSISKIAIVFRVSGKIWSFAPEGPGMLKYKKKDQRISVDFVILESQWKGVSSEGVVRVIADGIRRCFDFIIVKVKEVDELVDEERFLADVDKAISIFLDSNDA